jgi:hypothetical protein
VKTVEAPRRLEAVLLDRGTTLATAGALAAVGAMCDFYATVRAADTDLDANGDMLLFQWGTYDWSSGPSFAYNITLNSSSLAT